MKAKKQFTTPTVLQTVPIELERDLLLGASAELQVLAAGQDYFEWNMDVEGSFDGMGTYGADDWTFSD